MVMKMSLKKITKPVKFKIPIDNKCAPLKNTSCWKLSKLSGWYKLRKLLI
jgi:hypothetical protein